MLRMAQVNNIKDLYENEDLSLREISRQTGHSFKTVQKYAYQLDWSEDNLPDTEPMNCTPIVRQYDILITIGVFFYAKRSTKQAIYARI